MNLKQQRVIVGIIGVAIISGIVISTVFPQNAVAGMKWIDKKSVYTQANPPAKEVEEESIDTDEENREQQVEGVINTDAVITDNNGAKKHVIVSHIGKETAVNVVEKEVVAELQQQVNRGKHQWLLDPVAVVKNNASKYGFDVNRDTFTLISQSNNGNTSGTGKAYVLVGHGSQFYLVKLAQPTGVGSSKIWQIVSIKEAQVDQTETPHKPDVGPGVEGLDYDKVVKWQQAVDEGRELWRLDPMLVAKNEGKAFGFSKNDSYKVIRKLSSSEVSRHGQIDMEVIHNGKKYTMILVKPFGGGDAIWTTYKVTGTVVQPGNPEGEQVLYTTDKYKDWQWYLPQYPQDMGVAAVYSYQLQARDQRVPQPVLDKLNKVDLTNKVALVAYLGGTSSRNNIGIEKITVNGNKMTVKVRTNSPRLGAPMTMDLVYPSDYVLVDRDIFKDAGDMNVSFVDQKGKTIGKMTLTIR